MNNRRQLSRLSWLTLALVGVVVVVLIGLVSVCQHAEATQQAKQGESRLFGQPRLVDHQAELSSRQFEEQIDKSGHHHLETNGNHLSSTGASQGRALGTKMDKLKKKKAKKKLKKKLKKLKHKAHHKLHDLTHHG